MNPVVRYTRSIQYACCSRTVPQPWLHCYQNEDNEVRIFIWDSRQVVETIKMPTQLDFSRAEVVEDNYLPLSDGFCNFGQPINLSNVSYKWNPWHGCAKVSPGCQHCYVERLDNRFGKYPLHFYINGTIDLPVQRRKNAYVIPSHRYVFTCFTSDFFYEQVPDNIFVKAMNFIIQRSDCKFMIPTKRIEGLLRAQALLAPAMYLAFLQNCIFLVTCENQAMYNKRMTWLHSYAMANDVKVNFAILFEPLLERIDINAYANDALFAVVGGESGPSARPCSYDWVLSLHSQLTMRGVKVWFKQTGANWFDQRGEHHTYNRPEMGQAAKDYDLSTIIISNSN